MTDILDALEQTKYNKNEVKYLIKNLKAKLNPLIEKDLYSIWSVDEELIINILRSQEQLVNMLSDLNPEESLIIQQIIGTYCEDKEAFLSKFPINITKLG